MKYAVGLTALTVGGLLIWSGFTDTDLVATVKSVIQGNTPKPIKRGSTAP